MELRHFRAFIAVAEELHFTRAALRLNLSPPSLTVQIQELESGLAAELFVRTKRSVRLSSAGEAFLPDARSALAQVERAAETARRAGRGQLGRIAIGFVASAAYSGVLQQQVAAFRETHPGVHVDAAEMPMNKIAAMVDAGTLDVAFARLPLTLPAGLRAHVLLRDRFCLALPARHRLANKRKPVEPHEIADETFVLPEQEAGTFETGRRGGFQPVLGAQPGNLVAVATLVSLGSGIAVVPNSLCNCVHIPGVVFRDLAGTAIHSEIAAIFRSSEHSASIKAFIKQMTVAQPAGPLPLKKKTAAA
jgi:DNA-binding transcriptional LysR family regulator